MDINLTNVAPKNVADAHYANTDNPHSVTKSQVGLGNVDNTSDANKPVSTAQQTALDTKLSTISGITAGGELSGTYPNPAVLNSAVLAKVLTGLSVSGSSIAATDTLLQAFGKLQSQLNGILGGAVYQSVWNPTTNTPTLADVTGVKGNYYVVSGIGAGTFTINLGSGNIEFADGDWAIHNGTIYQKVDNTDAVSSVNGQIGAVSLTSANITEVTNLYFTTARVLATALTGYVSGAGTVAATDTILQAIQKLNGNIAALTTANVASSTDKRYVTDAQQTVIANTSGTNSGDNATNSQYSGLAASKADVASPTFTGTVTTPAIIINSETASRVAIIDASKKVISADTTIYPSLTELAYLKGVTGAIQAQINKRAAIFKAYNTSAQAVNTNVTAIITNWTTEWDDDSAFNATTGVYTIPRTGRYQINGSILVNTTAYTTGNNRFHILHIADSSAAIRASGIFTNIMATQTNYMSVSISSTLSLSTGDTVTLIWINSSGGNTSLISSTTYNRFEINELQ